jgi:hypothetical protein
MLTQLVKQLRACGFDVEPAPLSAESYDFETFTVDDRPIKGYVYVDNPDEPHTVRSPPMHESACSRPTSVAQQPLLRRSHGFARARADARARRRAT